MALNDVLWPQTAVSNFLWYHVFRKSHNQCIQRADKSGTSFCLRKKRATFVCPLMQAFQAAAPPGIAVLTTSSTLPRRLRRNKVLDRHREPYHQATLACNAPGAGQHRDSTRNHKAGEVQNGPRNCSLMAVFGL